MYKGPEADMSVNFLRTRRPRVCWDRVSKGGVAPDAITKSRKFGFWSKCKRKTLKGFKQKNDKIFRLTLSVTHKNNLEEDKNF